MQTSSLLHILGSDLFHGALDGDGGEDRTEGVGRERSAKPAGRLDELNNSAYPVPGASALGSMQATSMAAPAHPGGSNYSQNPFVGRSASNSGSGYSQGAPQRHGQGLEAHASHRSGAGEQPEGEARGEWIQEQVAAEYFRGVRGQGLHGYGAGGPMKGGRGQWNGPGVPFQGASTTGRGGYVNHMRGGAPAEVPSGAGPGFRPSGGPARPGADLEQSGGKSAESRHHVNVGHKGAKTSMQGQHQLLVNGRMEGRQISPAAANQERPTEEEGHASELQNSASRPDALQSQASRQSSGPSAASPLAPAEEVQGADLVIGDEGTSATGKEAAEKARKEAKKKSKKEKMKKGKEDSTPSSTPQDTPVIGALQSPEQTPPLSSLSLEKPNAPSDQEIVKGSTSAGNDRADAAAVEGPATVKDKSKGQAPSLKASSAGQLAGGAAAPSANKTADGGKADKASKGVAPSAKKPKESNNKKGQHNQKHQQSQVRYRRSLLFVRCAVSASESLQHA